jgi:molybdenum cofactor biosynthesis enzyme MoaA
MSGSNNYYCSQKFWDMSVDLEKKEMYSCCSAMPHKIDVESIKHNTELLFNSDVLISERRQMLEGIPVDSCKKTCWDLEEKGLTSRRLQYKSNLKTHTNLHNVPESVNIVVGSDCNMTCVYCCKQYSSSWRNDILSNGNYNVSSSDDRFTLTNKDKVLAQVSQKMLSSASFNQNLINAICAVTENDSCEEINISGGETFLYNDLVKLINQIPENNIIKLWTGLGVNTNRLNRQLDKIRKNENIHLVVSAENIEEFYEFNRYGNTWKNFEDNLKALQQHNISYSFNATLSNLTLFGFSDFVDYAKDIEINISLCATPSFLNINVLDAESKNSIKQSLMSVNTNTKYLIDSTIDIEPMITQVANLRSYILDFSNRRNLDYNIFPNSFINWITQ